MEKQPDVTVVIVTYQVRELALHCLASLFAFTRDVSFEVFVVDNASGDGTCDAIRSAFPSVHVIENERNLGFAAANNLALRLAKGRHVLLLNPDTELTEDVGASLVRLVDARRDVGVIGPKVLNSDGTVQRGVLAFPALCSQTLILLKLHHLFPRATSLKKYFLPDFDYSREQAVDQVIGACFLITRAALDTVGLLDERYFIWFEEVDYCRMVKDAKLEVLYTPAASIVHHGGQSFSQVISTKKQRYYDDSLAKYFVKHGRPVASLVIRCLHPLALGLAWIVGKAGIRRKKYA